jgi:hypothetical protein
LDAPLDGRQELDLLRLGFLRPHAGGQRELRFPTLVIEFFVFVAHIGRDGLAH